MNKHIRTDLNNLVQTYTNEYTQTNNNEHTQTMQRSNDAMAPATMYNVMQYRHATMYYMYNNAMLYGHLITPNS